MEKSIPIMRDEISRQVHIEISRANVQLASLAGTCIDSIIINSSDPREAPYLSMLLPRLSPYIGNLLERRVADLLNREVRHGFRWIHQEQDIPETCLLSPGNISTECGFEVKAWHALSSKITSRFRVSTQQLKGRNIRLVIISWMMTKVLFGAPTILDVLSVDAYSVARLRDFNYHNPPENLIIEPEDIQNDGDSLQRNHVNGYRIMEREPEALEAAWAAARSHPDFQAPPGSERAQDFSRMLLEKYEYKLDGKFAKIDWAKHPEVEAFKSNVLRMEPYGCPLKDWPFVLRGMQNTDNREADGQSLKLLEELYSQEAEGCIRRTTR